MQTAVVAYFIFALINYRLAVLLLAPIGLFLSHFPFVDGQIFSYFDACCLGLSALLPIKTNFISKLKTYPFLVPSLLVLTSYCVTNMLAEAHWPSTIFTFNTIHMFPFVVWCVLDEKKDVRWLLGGYVVLFSFSVIYALIELALNDNVILDSLITKRLVNENVLNYDEIRFGVKRLQSIFCTPMSMGLAMSTFAYVLYEKGKMMRQKNFFLFVLMMMCFILPWLSGARSVFIAALIILFPVLKSTLKSRRFALLKIGVIGGIIFAGGGWIWSLVDSFIHSDTAVTGSSFEMRLMQFAVILPFFLNSPIWGNGFAFVWTFVKAVDKDILGAESIWLQILVDYGLLGAVGYIACIYAIYRSLTKFKPEGKYLPIAIVLGYTMSTFLELEMNFFFIMSIILIKSYEWDEEEKLEIDEMENADGDLGEEKISDEE